MTKHKDHKINTQLITGGRRKEWTHGVVNPPVYHASTCIFETYQEMQDRIADMSGHNLFYGRKGTPTQWSLQETICDLEGDNAAGTMLYPSGLSAISGAVMSVVKAGDHILITDSAYEPTRALANGILARMGVETTYYDPMIGAAIKDLMQNNTSLILVEAPGSLTFEVQDIPAIAAVAHGAGTVVIMDNTWGTPLMCKGLDIGADIVVHAGTKYMVGHSDAMMGAATANKACFPALQNTAFTLGFTLGPDDAYLTSRGMRTMGLRLKQHESSALTIAKWLANHPAVDHVLHPALPNCPGHEIWKRDFSGSTGLFSFVLKQGDYPDTAALVDDLVLYKMGFSWGGYESLILPSDPSRCRSVTQWQAPGPLIRIHIGLEDVDDLKADLNAGLNRYMDQF